jgi:transposase
MQYEVISSRAVDSQTCVINDKIIRLTEKAFIEKYPDELRMVVYEDFATGNVYRFITNHTGYEALTIAELYKERWNVELFKWIKQHLHIKSFYGTSENAVYTQIWIAVCAFLLLALAEKKMHIDEPSLYMISQTIGTMLFEKIPVRELFNKPNLNVSSDDGQLELFRDRKS